VSIQEIKKLAKEKCLRVRNIKKENLIKRIQVVEGNFDCFGTAVTGVCDQVVCLWREDCLN
jgi:hypothetical protein